MLLKESTLLPNANSNETNGMRAQFDVLAIIYYQ